MAAMRKRVSALEDYVEGRIREGMERKIEAALDRLERNLGREEFVRVLEVLSKGEERGD